MKDQIELCFRCMCWHAKPKCRWNWEARCVECDRCVGYPAGDQPRNPLVCNRCWLRSQGIVIPEVAPATDPQDERFAELFMEPR